MNRHDNTDSVIRKFPKKFSGSVKFNAKNKLDKVSQRE